MVNPSMLNVCSIERGVWYFPFPLLREPRELSSMEEGNVHSITYCMEAAAKEIICVCGSTVGPTPQCDAVCQSYWSKDWVLENVDILAPLHVGIDALRTKPVMVAWSDINRNGFDFSECSLEKSSGVRCDPLVLIQVACTEERTSIDLTHKFPYAEECVSKRLSPAPSGVSRCPTPSKRRVEV